AEERGAAVGRAVVDDEQLEGATRRAPERQRVADDARQIGALVERGNDDRQRRRKRDHDSVAAMRVGSLAALVLLPPFLLGSACRRAHDVEMRAVALHADQEEKLADQPLSASTQSVNRYRSILSRFDAVDVAYEAAH